MNVPAVNSASTPAIVRLSVWGPVGLFAVVNGVLLYLCFELNFAAAVRLVYSFNTLVMPAILLTTAAAMYPAAGRRTRGVALCWALSGVALFALRIYATHFEPRNLQVREVTIASDKIKKPFTLLHISDIQSAGIGAYEREVFQKIAELHPDLLLNTGDLLQPIAPLTMQTELPKLAGLFRGLCPPMGMYTVQGDTDGPLVRSTPAETGGIAYLLNQEAIIQRGEDRIRVYGLNLRSSSHVSWARTGIGRWLAEDPGALNIVMGHRPDFIMKFNDLPIDLCLAGHTHGGQIRIPFYGPPVIFCNIPRAWARGFRKVGNTRLNVSAGIGAEHHGALPSIRINCPPEMTLIRFVPVGKK